MTKSAGHSGLIIFGSPPSNLNADLIAKSKIKSIKTKYKINFKSIKYQQNQQRQQHRLSLVEEL